MVQQQQPKVTVDQAQPEITVHQPAPTITVDIPKPVITIRMPKPQVNVAVGQPRVEVSQAKPQVNVVPAGQPHVSVQQAGQQPNVTVQDNNQQAPKVTYNSDQPKVVVNRDQGAPTVHVEQIGQNTPNTPNAPQPNPAPLGALTLGTPNAAGTAGTQAVQVSHLLKMNVVNAHGDTLGDVEHVLTHTADAKTYVVIGHGGFLGLGEKQVALPLDNMFERDGKLVMRGMTDNQIRAMPAWKEGNREYTDVSGSQEVQVSNTAG